MIGSNSFCLTMNACNFQWPFVLHDFILFTVKALQESFSEIFQPPPPLKDQMVHSLTQLNLYLQTKQQEMARQVSKLGKDYHLEILCKTM